MNTWNICAGSSQAAGSPGTFRIGTEGMPLSLPSRASPTEYSGPAVWLMSFRKISVTTMVTTPRQTSESRQ